MASERVGIIVVNWNGEERTAACLRSLLALDDIGDARITVVDNGSVDGSGERLRHAFPQVDILMLPKNRGYAGACNAGAAAARRNGARYVWLLNNDTEVDRHSLRALRRAASERAGRLAIFAPKILDPDGRIWSAGGTLRWPRLERGMRGQGAPAASHAEPCEVPWASGCSLFAPIEVFDAVGPFDERYFMYMEDVDWCLAARRCAIPIIFVPDARILHGVSSSVRALNPSILRYYECRNYLLLAWRHGGRAGRVWATGRVAITLAKTAVRVAASPRCRHDTYYHAQTRALRDAMRGRWGRAPYDDTPRIRCVTPELERAGPVR